MLAMPRSKTEIEFTEKFQNICGHSNNNLVNTRSWVQISAGPGIFCGPKDVLPPTIKAHVHHNPLSGIRIHP